jgi:predicted NAD-dependent protein-ADP-ribosyltransferase YbiA (DUF1768 family)
MANELFPGATPTVNLGVQIPDLTKGLTEVQGVSRNSTPMPEMDMVDIVNNRLAKTHPKQNTLPIAFGSEVDMSGRFPLQIPGQDNEQAYAVHQTLGEKAVNGVAKFAGIATSAFINGTVGTVYGATKALLDQDPTSFWKNDLSENLNEYTKNLENSYAHYKTERERKGDWWEPSNLFTGNFFFDNIVKNLGYTVGSIGAGFVFGGALKVFNLTSKIAGYGAKWAGAADAAIAENIALGEAASITNTTSKLESILAQAKSTVGNVLKDPKQIDRAIVASTGTAAEAGFEALNNSQEFRQKMIEKFVEEHGYQPNKEDIAKINAYAENVGNYSWLANTALLTLTNFIQLPKIMSSTFKGERGVANAAFINGTWERSLPKEGFKKFLYQGYKVGGLVFNPSEAFEEGAQFAIQSGTQNYFNKQYKGQPIQFMKDGLQYGIDEALTSDEGLLNIFTGGFSGGISTAVGSVKERGFTGYGGEEDRTRSAAFKAWNESRASDVLMAATANAKIAEVVQGERADAIALNDKLESKDKEYDYAHTFITSRLKYNAKEAIDIEIAELEKQALTNFDDLQKQGKAAQTDTPESFIARLNLLKEQANIVESITNATKLAYEGIVDPETNKRKYSNNIIDKLVYAKSKVSDYNRRIPQVDQKLSSVGISTTEAMEEINTTGQISDEKRDGLLAEIDKLPLLDVSDKTELTQNAKDFMEMGIRRKKFLSEFNDIVSNPEKYDVADIKAKIQDAMRKASEQTGEKETIKVKAKNGDLNLQIGKEYYSPRPATQNEKGEDVYKSPKFTLLGKNEDGTYRIKESDGTEIDVPANYFNKLHVGDMADAAKNSKLKFYLANWNKKYLHHGVKDREGKGIEGTLEYDATKDSLVFKYKNAKGKTVTREVKQSMFKAKKGYKQAMLQAVGKLTSEEQQALEDYLSSEDTLSSDPSYLRTKMITDLYNNTKERLDEVTEKLTKNKERLSTAQEDLNKINTEVDGGKKLTKKVKTTINNLAKLANDLTEEIASLEAEKTELESAIPYIENLYDNMDTLEGEAKDILEQVKKDINVLEDLIDNTNDAIKYNTDLLQATQEALTDALSLLSDYIKRLREENPGMPLNIEALQAQLERFQGEEGAKMFMEQRLGFTEAVLQLESDINDFADELKIPSLKSKTETLANAIGALTSKLDDLIAQQMSKATILDSFENTINEYEAQLAEEEKLRKDKALQKAILGTEDKSSVPVSRTDDTVETDSKKNTADIGSSTIPSQQFEGYDRSVRFGARFPNFPTELRNKIKGVVVNFRTQKALGIPGLTQHLATNEVDHQTMLPLVVVEEDEDGNLHLVNELGERIVKRETETALDFAKRTLDEAVYQVMPTEEFKWSETYGGQSMFQKGTDKDLIEEIKKQHAEDRAEYLASDELIPESIDVSFGVPVYNTYLDENQKKQPDYRTRTSAQDSGLITEDALETTPLITVPTTKGNERRGEVSIAAKVGMPLLALRNGLAKLINRNFNKKEAEVIYEMILRLSNNIFKYGVATSADSPEIVEWLKTVVYWGTPKDSEGKVKDPGFSSIFFEYANDEEDSLVLSISGKGLKIPFTPIELERRRDGLIAIIQGMYGNVNSTQATKNWDASYYQITGVNADNELVKVRWENYQSYLLSNKNPDGSPRTTENIPLATRLKPIETPTDINRDSIYFTITGKRDYYKAKVEAAEKKAEKKATVANRKAIASKKLTPANKAPKAKKTTSEPKAPKTTGKDLNTIQLESHPYLGEIEYTAVKNPTGGYDVDVKINDEMRSVASDPENQEAIQKLFAIAKIAYPADAPLDFDAAKDLRPEELFKIASQLIISAQLMQNKITPQKAAKEQVEEEVEEETTEIEGLQERLNSYGYAEVVLPDNFNEGPRPIGRLNSFKSSIAQVADNLQILIDLNLDEFDFLTEEDKERLDALRPLAKELNELNTGAISSASTRTVAVEKRYAELTNELSNEFVDIIGKHVEEQLGKTITSSTNTEEKTTEEEEQTPEQLVRERQRRRKPSPGKTKFRISKLLESINQYEGENWDKITSFMKANFPTIPLYRVKNLIQGPNGVRAFGMLKDSAIYLAENAEIGSIYHEVFEAVMDMFTTPAERSALRAEFRARTGTFVDRETGRTIEYSKASNDEIREQMAEEARDFFQYGKRPVAANKKSSAIAQFFADLWEFIKEFFVGPQAKSSLEKIFQQMGSGYYAQASANDSALSFAKAGIIDIEDAFGDNASKYRIAGLTASQLNDILQNMTYEAVLTIFDRPDTNLFEFNNINKDILYDELKDATLDVIDEKSDEFDKAYAQKLISKEHHDKLIINQENLLTIVNQQWDNIFNELDSYLKKFGIEFDENDNLILNDENNSGRGDYQQADKIDSLKKANAAVKLLISSLPKIDQETGEFILTPLGGHSLIPTAQAYVTIQNAVEGARNVEEMITLLNQLAERDKNYARLVNRLTQGGDLADLNTEGDINLVNAFWRLFKKQNPDVKNVYILANGDIQVGDSNFSTAARQVKKDFLAGLINTARSGASLYVKKSGINYVGRKESLRNVDLKKTSGQVAFLKNLGIVGFTRQQVDKLKEQDRKNFDDALKGIYESISKGNKIISNQGKTLEIDGRLNTLSELKAKIDNPEFSSIYYNINGEKTQTFIGPNAASELFDALSKINNLEELRDTRYSYILTDDFARNSVLIKAMFNSKGFRKEKSQNYFKPGVLDGMNNAITNKKKPSSKLNFRERTILEMNLNNEGYFLSLVPGDASMEWMNYMGKHVTAKDPEEVLNIFKGYFMDELSLSRDTTRSFVQNKAETRSKKDLRFFKDILADNNAKTETERNALHTKIINAEGSIEEVYNANAKEINKAIVNFITRDANTFTENVLKQYEIVTESTKDEDSYKVENLPFITKSTISKQQFDKIMYANAANYMIANIELHKLLYSDPYQYADELKRIKNFNSPGQKIMAGSPKMNKAMERVYNKEFKKGEIGYSNFIRDHFRTITLADVKAVHDLKGYMKKAYDETDGGGMITFPAHRKFRIRAGEWNSAEEGQYRYDMAWEKREKAQRAEREGNKELAAKYWKQLTAKEMERLDRGNPGVKSAYTPLKPISRGNKDNGKAYNDIMLDKFALFPISYRILHELSDKNEAGDLVNATNALKLYDKMIAEDIDYAVYASGRKVGAEEINDLYDKSGAMNTSKFKGIVNVPFAIIDIQSEVPSKTEDLVTRGSQATKLITMDFMEGGVPVDYMPNEKSFEKRFIAWSQEKNKEGNSKLYKEIKNNQILLEAITETGYKSLLKKLGLTKTKDGYVVSDIDKVIDLLTDSIASRDVNDNVISALEGMRAGQVIMEATPAYDQLRNILYSIADSTVFSPKITGGQKVQMTSRLLETVGAKKDPIEGKSYISDVLQFYKDEDGKRVCEIMIGRWFKSDKTDEELMNYFNNTEEGKAQLAAITGIAFRIPTQKQNSIDAFRIAKFLPKEFGDSVIVPGPLVQKAGSDFDIDKLSIYLKNLRTGKNGYPEVINYLTNDNSTVEQRYYNWVIDNADKDASKYIRFLAKGEVSKLRNTFKTRFEELNQLYKGTVARSKEIKYGELLDTFNSIKRDALGQQDEYIAELFAIGSEMFRELDGSVKENFFNLKKALAVQKINGPEEIRRYLALATMLQQDESTPAKDKKVLADMSSIYEQELQVLGATQDEVQKAIDGALDAYRKDKAQAIQAIGTYVSDMASEIKAEQANAREQFNLEYATELAEAANLPSLSTFGNYSIQMQNTKDALQNAYIQSSENLVTSPENFGQLTKPNSADQLKDLAGEINGLLGIAETDYSSPGNMLSREFMSKLRHAFVTGKYAIGIAAVNQTNHANNQRMFMFLDRPKIENMSEEDRMWLGDGVINFEQKNEVDHPTLGKVVTLSMIKNKAKEYISDILGQFIDGYVDIAKGPWIMELGATPNVASTWMFLVKAGVPIRDVAIFMNQPIIRDFLRKLESQGYSWLFNDGVLEDTLEDYSSTMSERSTKIPDANTLAGLVGKKRSKLTSSEKAEQRYMLKEFLKYARMANHLYQVTQGSNFDTATINDPFIVFKKGMQLARAQDTVLSSLDEDGNVVSGVDNLMKESFIKNLYDYIKEVRDGLAKFLISDSGNIRPLMERVLEPYVDLPDRDFSRVAQMAVKSLFDWAVQVDSKMAAFIPELLISDEENFAKKMMKFVDEVKADRKHDLYNNEVINSLRMTSIDQDGSNVYNIQVINKDNKVYDQNQIIYAFEEIKNYLKGREDEDLYKNLVNVAVLQSGLTSSPISFTSLLPYEDFKDVYNEVLSKIDKMTNLNDFYSINAFQRNNWNNSDVVPTKRGKWKFSEATGRKFNPDLILPKAVNQAVAFKNLPMILKISAFSKESNSDVINYTWEDPKLTSQQKFAMRAKGDYSFIYKGLFQRVKGVDGKPYMITKTGNDDKTYKSYVYKMINAWGDGFRANEYYDTNRDSVIDNGYIKVVNAQNSKGQRISKSEVTDANVLYYFDKILGTPVQNEQTEDVEKINVMYTSGEYKDLSNFAFKRFRTVIAGKYRVFLTVEGALQASKLLYTNSYLKTRKLTADQQKTLESLLRSNGYDAKKIGGAIKDLNVKQWDGAYEKVMKKLLTESFTQNPDKLETLLNTGNMRITHKIGGVEQDKGRFSKIIMEVRDELRGDQGDVIDDNPTEEETILLRGKAWDKADVTAENLLAAGFSVKEIGKILKEQIC